MLAITHILVHISGSDDLDRSPPEHNGGGGAVCIANISPRERRKRLIGGLILFSLTIAILAVQIAAGADRLWRLPLLFLFWASASGYFQWRGKT